MHILWVKYLIKLIFIQIKLDQISRDEIEKKMW